jgi:hypothetical protein
MYRGRGAGGVRGGSGGAVITFGKGGAPCPQTNLKGWKMGKKLVGIDGLGPKEISRIRSALRDVWRYSKAHQIVKKRCIGKDGFPRCEKCLKKCPQILVDHIVPCGTPLEPGYVHRLMVPSNMLQGLCKKCHDKKTRQERLRNSFKDPKDFF